MKSLRVIDIIANSIKANGYDGLYDEHGECACELSDLAPCGGLQNGCTMGYVYWCEDADCEFTDDNGKHFHMRSVK